MGDNKDIVEFICQEIGKLADVKSELTAETDLTTDLNINSVLVMDLVFTLEEKYDISIPLNDLSDVYKIGELADLVKKMSNS